MKHSVDEMRTLAAASRAAADAEPLANARMKHLAAADKWEKLAVQSEAVSALRARREDTA